MLGEDRQNRLALGAFCVIGAALMFSLAGMSIKLVAGSLSNESIVFWRNVISLAILAPWAMVNRAQWFRRQNMKLITMRALAVLASLYCYYYAVAAIPLTDAVLLNFSSPIFVPVLGLLMFRFSLDRSVLLAVLIGFLGVSLVLKPGAGVFEPAALVGLVGGGLGGLAVVALWRMPGGEHPARIAFFFALIGVGISAVPVVVSAEWPSGSTWLWLVMLGVFSTAAHLLLALGCLIAPADRVITLDYTAVFFASALGWMIWGEEPDLLLILGGALIIGAGIYVMRPQPKRPSPAQTQRAALSSSIGAACSLGRQGAVAGMRPAKAWRLARR